MSALVRIENDRAVADSRDVAKQFGKRHGDVLRAIDTMIEDAEELQRNFAPQLFEVKQNAAIRRYRRFDMDRKGFIALVMGFSGAKALAIRLRWIDAFDAMEEKLSALRESTNDDEPIGSSGGPAIIADYAPALAVIREARQVFGRAAAQRLWSKVGLPEVFDRPGERAAIGMAAPQSIQDWMLQCVQIDAEAYETAADLYASYQAWCDDMAVSAETQTRFGTVLSKLGHAKAHDHRIGRVIRRGIKLRA